MSRGVCVVLSGGGARGVAHIGVLKVLDEEGIPVRSIVGSSAGALVGALYASCKDASKVASFVKALPLYKLPDLSLSGQGLISGERLGGFVKEFTRAETFADLQLPLVVNATDLRTGKEVVFKEGSLLPALHATSAFPGVIKPLVLGDLLLIDGGVSDTLPLKLASRSLPVVASDVTGIASLPKKPNIFSVMRQSLHILTMNAVSQERFSDKRLLRVRPDVLDWEVFSLRDLDELIARGERAMKASLPQLRRLLR